MNAHDATSKGVAEREGLRSDRARNYRIKQAAGWTCQHDGCTTSHGLLVVSVRKRDLTDGRYQTRCRRHLGKLKPEPGQGIDNREDDE